MSNETNPVFSDTPPALWTAIQEHLALAASRDQKGHAYLSPGHEVARLLVSGEWIVPKTGTYAIYYAGPGGNGGRGGEAGWWPGGGGRGGAAGGRGGNGGTGGGASGFGSGSGGGGGGGGNNPSDSGAPSNIAGRAGNGASGGYRGRNGSNAGDHANDAISSGGGGGGGGSLVQKYVVALIAGQKVPYVIGAAGGNTTILGKSSATVQPIQTSGGAGGAGGALGHNGNPGGRGQEIISESDALLAELGISAANLGDGEGLRNSLPAPTTISGRVFLGSAGAPGIIIIHQL